MGEKENQSQNDEALLDSLGQIILASGDYYILRGSVSDAVIGVLQKHSDYVAAKFRSRLGSVDSLSLPHLIASLSDAPVHVARIYNFIFTRSLVNGSIDETESPKILNSSPSNLLTIFRTTCDDLKINVEENPQLPSCLQVGQHIRSQRIDAFVTHKSTTEQYEDFSRLRNRATLFGQPFNLWLERGGFTFSQTSDGAKILAYLVTLCLRDVVDCALFNRQRFGIDLFSQVTAIELQQASSVLRKMKEYL
ncbi:unnamed protein product [Hymenolepis diminuta]|uniref:Uncharacterized protein n=2 Tax=Hymenolepis diminuta TaxID=6216 RepID=A0A0R3SDK6_HYMDI|nr:unnamed protein product [Hymenolepis diminuta]